MENKFGERLRAFRKERALTQQQVADVLNLNRTTYTKYETGVSEPSHEVLKKIVSLFEITYDDLFSENEALAGGFSDSDDGDTALSNDEKEFISIYRNLSDEKKAEIKQNMNSLLSDKK